MITNLSIEEDGIELFSGNISPSYNSINLDTLKAEDSAYSSYSVEVTKPK